MSFHLQAPPAVILRKLMIGMTFFFLSALTLHSFSNFGLIILPAQHTFLIYGLLAAASLIATLLVKPADRAAKSVLRETLLRRECYAHINLLDLTKELQSILQLREMSNLTVNSFAESFHLKTTALFVLRPEQDAFEAVSTYGWPSSDLRRTRLSSHSLLAEVLRQGGEHTLTRNILIKSAPWQDANSLENDFNSIRAGWVLPLFFKKELLGFLAWGTESPEHTFQKADFEFFLRFAREISTCLKNAIEVEALTKRNEELQGEYSQRFQTSKLRAVSQLAEGLAHEIHNPLAIISGKAQVLLFKKKDPDWPKKVEESLTVMIQQSKRAADIIRKVLSSVRESQSPSREINLRKAALETLELLRYQTSLKQIEVTVHADEDLVFYANPGDIYELFSSLILNGIETLGSHGWIRFDMHALRGEEAIEILVTDSGCGMLPETLAQVFDPFFKTRHEAVGLGLFSAKQIVHRYGGSIRAESRMGEGVLFQIRLPLHRVVEKLEVPTKAEFEVSEPVQERK